MATKVKTKTKVIEKHVVVAVYDKRVPCFAMRNVRLVIKGDVEDEAIAEKALAEVYTDKGVQNDNCTHVLIYPADKTYHVIDGDIYRPVVFHKGIDPTPYKSNKEEE
jgi:hypothetical protein